MALRFSVGKNKAGEPSWWLYGANRKKVAWAGETFDSPADARRAAREFKASAAGADFDIYLDDAKEWRWRAWVSSDKVASSGESFDSKSNAERAAKNVQENGGSATGLD